MYILIYSYIVLYGVIYSRTTSYFHIFIVFILVLYAFYLVTVKLWSDFEELPTAF